MKRFQRFLKDEEGATAVEYGIMLALIAGVIIATVTAIGVGLNVVFGNAAAVLPAGG